MRSEGVDVILQMTVRDRNRIALAADALGAAALGVRGFLALWGDPVAVGDLVVLGHDGVARIEDISSVDIDGEPARGGGGGAGGGAPLVD